MTHTKTLTILATLAVGLTGFGCESNNTVNDSDMHRNDSTHRTNTMTDTNKMRGQGATMNGSNDSNSTSSK